MRLCFFSIISSVVSCTLSSLSDFNPCILSLPLLFVGGDRSQEAPLSSTHVFIVLFDFVFFFLFFFQFFEILYKNTYLN